MGTVTFSSAAMVGNQTINASGSYTSYGMTQSGSWPSSPYKITSAKLTYTVRTTSYTSFTCYRSDTSASLGSCPGETGGTVTWPLSNTNKADYVGLTGIILKGNGGSSAQLSSGSNVVITVTWELTTTACSAPTNVTLSETIAEESATLSWTGAKGGTGNAIASYGIQYRESADGSSWGAWADYTSIASTVSYGSVTVGTSETRGNYRQYRIRTVGSAGGSYASEYTVCGALLRKNRAPGVPTLTHPASGATYCQTPYVLITAGTESDGQTQTTQLSVDDGDWVTWTGGRVSLAAGSHTLRARSVDSMGAASDVASRDVTVSTPAWARTIAAGDVIANTTVSHRADITELLAAVNMERAWYGLAALTLSGMGSFGAWRENMSTLRAGLNSCYQRAGEASPEWTTLTGWPSAAIINQIREKVAAI